MQTILGNPLASPFTLGVSSAAPFGAALAIVPGIGIPGVQQNWIISANAFVFSFIAVIVLQSAVQLRGSGTDILVLCGIALFLTFNALVALTQFLASQGAAAAGVLHDLQAAARWADEIVVMTRGGLYACGAPVATVTAAMLKDVYQVVGSVETTAGGGLHVSIDELLERDEPRDG